MNPLPATAAAITVLFAHEWAGWFDGALPVVIPAVTGWLVMATGDKSFSVPLPCDHRNTVDGDTVDINHAGNIIRIRVYGIDAPEADQSYGQESKRKLHDLLQAGAVSWQPTGQNSRDRSVARLFVNGDDVGLKMVECGLAWPADPKYMPPAEYFAAHRVARDNKAGLFADKNPIHPADWRKRKEQKQKAPD